MSSSSAGSMQRWALSPLDSRSHLLPTDDQPQPPGILVSLCGHQMPCSARVSGEPLDHRVCRMCQAVAALEAPAPQFRAGTDRGPAMPPRLSVLISPRTEAALLEMRVNEGVSFTEAVRRLVGYGQAVYRANRVGREIVLRGGGRPPERLSVLDIPEEYGVGPLAGSATESWRERRDRHHHG